MVLLFFLYNLLITDGVEREILPRQVHVIQENGMYYAEDIDGQFRVLTDSVFAAELKHIQADSMNEKMVILSSDEIYIEN